MTAKTFVKAYETALRSQDWAQIAPLIDAQARVIFSDGSLHVGIVAIRAAYQRNFNAIQNEDYRIENVDWLMETADAAAYVFEFRWTGVIAGRQSSGAGRGTAVLMRQADGWRMITEQLGPKS